MKPLTIFIAVLLALSLVVAIGGEIILSNLTISLSKEKLDVLKATNDIKSLDLKATNITCDKRWCHAWVKQEGLINSEWIVPYDKSKTMNDYNILLINYTQDKLNRYADVQTDRQDVVIK